MKIKQQYFKSIIVISVIILLCGSYVMYNIYVNLARHKYKTQIIKNTRLFLAQQQGVLRQLSKNILEPIKHQDIAIISVNIRAYEDVLFSISKSGLALPARINFVSLSGPQQIIGSNGKLNDKSLATDQKYYMDVMNNPNAITISNAYEELSMPGFLLCNLGIGVLGHDNKFHGQLDMQVSLSALYDYIATNTLHHSVLFKFKLNTNNVLQPDITLNHTIYLYGLLGVWIIVILGTLFIISITKFIFSFKHNYKQQTHELAAARTKLDKLRIDTDIVNAARQVQYKYGVLAANEACAESLIDLRQILQDVQAVNSEDAKTRNISVDLAMPLNYSLRFYSNRLRLMQILSAILSESISVLPANSVITLQVDVVPLQNNLHQIIFKFHDNGFYSKLEHRHALVSNADVRVHGWNNINALIDLELGELQHVHTAYTGNTISVSITRNIEQKVVSIEGYY